MNATAYASATAGADEADRLPPLRADLDLLPGPRAADGGPTWVVVDPVRNKHFRIGWQAFQMLSRWGLGSRTALLARIAEETALRLDDVDLDAVLDFLEQNNLTASGGEWRRYLRQLRAARRSWWQHLVHTYLFVKIPLVRPTAFLRRTQHWVRPLFGRSAAVLIGLCGALGVFLVARQWDVFVASFAAFASAESLLLFGLALAVVKVVHELGHAYAASLRGCQVPTMGVALLVLFPVLFTDTTTAWRLASRRDRLAIGLAGMGAELYVAMLATLAWSFFPEGALRSIAFFLASTSWLMSFAVNLNPFMRFDGYYLLGDWLGVDNLQDRAFALARWRLRESLFGLGMPPPEVFAKRLERGLVIYAWCTWAYRLVLFIGIALLVYHLFFKLLGVLALVVELGWFIARPLYRELRAWFGLRRQIVAAPRFPLTLLAFLGGLFLLGYPWSTRVSVPAVMEAQPRAQIFAPVPARILEVFVKRGALVAEGAPLIGLESPRLDTEILMAERRIELLELRLRRQAANAEDREKREVHARQLRQERANLQGLQALRDQLLVTAPFRGRVLDVVDGLASGRWVNPKTALLRVGGQAGAVLRGAVGETQLLRLAPGQTGTFYPDDAARGIVNVELLEVNPTSMARLDIAYLAAPHGGPIEVTVGAERRLVPQSALFMVTLSPRAPVAAPAQVVRGVVHLEGQRESIAARAAALVGAVLVRELGF